MNFFRPIRRMLAAAALTLAATAPAQAANTAFSGAAVSGCSYASASQTYTCTSLPLPNYNDTISIPSGYTVVVNSAVSFGYNQGLTMSGTASLQTSGDLDISGINPSNLAVSGGTLSTNGAFSVGAQAQTITANISAASMNTGTVAISSNVTIIGPISGTTITTNSPVSLTGNVTASTAFTLASGSSLVGNITAPTVTLNPSSVTVKGNIAAATSLSIGSGNSVNGSVSGGALTLSPSSASIIGNVTMTGDIDIGSGDNITGNVVAHNVTTESSNGYISGNASVSGITFNYGGYVGGTITCTAPGASGCSCVNNTNSGRAAPTCTTSAAFDHIQISQSGSGLTCQPSTVALTACANASCSAVYSTNATVTTQPGGQSFTLVNGVNNAATVQQSTAGTATLSATASIATTSPSTCINSSGGTACAMTFADTGFLISTAGASNVSNFLSGNAQTLNISALKKGTSTSASCQPALNGSQAVTFSCAYVNPTSGTLPAMIGSTPLAANSGSACSSGGANVNLSFNSSGVASTTLGYSDVGQLTLSASYQGSGTYAGLKISGTSNAFIVAPAALSVTVSPTNPAATTSSGGVFLRAGQPFTATVTALNSAGNGTPNYGNEIKNEAFLLSSKVILPTNPSATYTPQLNSGQTPTWTRVAATAATPVSYTSSALTWNEVGSIELDAALSNNGQFASAGYLGSGQTSATGKVNVGRFIPDHLAITIVPANNVPMACSSTTAPVFSIAHCPTQNQAVYSAQPFAVTVTAEALSNSVTQYYDTSTTLAQNVGFSGWANAASIVAADAHPSSTAAAAITSTIASAKFTSGVATAQPISYNFTSASPSPGPTLVYLRALDTDLTNMGGSAGATSAEPPMLVVLGRMLVTNNYGSETSPMPITLKAQYWNGSAYVNSIGDNNSTGYVFGTSGLAFTNCTQHLLAGSSCSSALKLPATPATVALKFTNGLFTFLLAAPGSGNSGGVDVSLKNTNNSISPDPTIFLPPVSGRATFGVYRGGPVIYLREVY